MAELGVQGAEVDAVDTADVEARQRGRPNLAADGRLAETEHAAGLGDADEDDGGHGATVTSPTRRFHNLDHLRARPSIPTTDSPPWEACRSPTRACADGFKIDSV